MLALLVLHTIALLFTDTAFFNQVVKDLIVASFLLAIYLLASEDTSSGFFFSLLPLALVTAVLGLIKAALLDRGYLIGFIIEGCSYSPAGSALCVNYNNLGLLWLVAALGCLKTRFWWGVLFLVAAGVLSSSRRFIILVGLIPFVWILIQGWSAVVKSVIVAMLAAALVYVVSDPVSFEKYRFGGEPYQVLSFNDLFKKRADEPSAEVIVDSLPGVDLGPIASDNQSVSGVDDPQGGIEAGRLDSKVAISRSTPGAMLSTLADGAAGTGSRLGFWKLGLSMLSWLPQGWAYHEVYSCSFSPCSEFNYPHMPVIAEWIIGGVVFGLVAIAFYAWPFWLVWRRKAVLPIALFMVAMPYSLISGDTVFSLPTCLACMFVALSSVARPNPRGTP